MNIPSLLHQFPVQALLGSIVPIVQFMASRLAAMRLVHRKRRLREQIVALNAFISSAEKHPQEDLAGAVLEDALVERGMILSQLAAAAGRNRRHRLPSPRTLQRLFLLYPPDRPAGWAFRWAFFTMLITTVTGTIRGIIHVNYLPMSILVPAMAATAALTIVTQLAASRMDEHRGPQSRRPGLNNGDAFKGPKRAYVAAGDSEFGADAENQS